MTIQSRKKIIGLAALICLTAWLSLPAAYLLTDSRGWFIAAVTAAALATEAFIWVAALIGGWTVFENRRKIWRRMTPRPKG